MGLVVLDFSLNLDLYNLKLKKMNRLFRIFTTCLFLFISTQVISAQSVKLNRVEPPNWWIGMENTELQLLIYGENISNAKPTIQYEGVLINSVTKLESINYLFINLTNMSYVILLSQDSMIPFYTFKRCKQI